jgi:hypothetical protein
MISYQGHVKNGVIVFDNQPPLADGTAVRIEPMRDESPVAPSGDGPSVWDELEKLAGSAIGLPADLAEHHDRHRRTRDSRQNGA